MASFVWMLLAEPTYKPNTLTARSLTGEESKPEDAGETTTFNGCGLVRRAGDYRVLRPGAAGAQSYLNTAEKASGSYPSQ